MNTSKLYYTHVRFLLLALQVEVMYKSYLDKLKSPQESTLPARELWMEIDRNTITMGSLVSHATIIEQYQDKFDWSFLPLL